MSINILKMDFVVPGPENAVIESAFVPAELPRPSLALDPVVFTVSGETANIQISGKVHDAIADNMPRGYVSAGLADIDSVSILEDDLVVVGPTDIIAQTTSDESFWSQHRFYHSAVWNSSEWSAFSRMRISD